MIPTPEELAQDLLGTCGEVPEDVTQAWSGASERKFGKLAARCGECGTWCPPRELERDRDGRLWCGECAG